MWHKRERGPTTRECADICMLLNTLPVQNGNVIFTQEQKEEFVTNAKIVMIDQTKYFDCIDLKKCKL